MRRSNPALALVTLASAVISGQPAPSRPPVIDMHVHSTNTTPAQTLERMKAFNLRFVFVSSLATDLPMWAVDMPANTYLPALVLPCDGGRAPITGRPCYPTPTELPDPDWLRGEVRAGRLKGLGEVSPQYLGMSPSDPRLDPYWAIAEEFDLPVGLHLGTAPPGIAYGTGPVPVPFRSPRFRVAAGDPLLVEEMLLRHPRLRVYVMHAGWPRLESMVALMYSHPQVYVDLAAIEVSTTTQAGFMHYLQGLLEAGFGKRIMFGSDFPNRVQPDIDRIATAESLSAEQKADILCNNAARFLRLQPSACQP